MANNRISYLRRKLKYFVCEKVKKTSFVYFLTLTQRGIDNDLFRKEYKRFINTLQKYFRRKGVQFDYFSVFEFQKRGSLHVHMMIVLNNVRDSKPMKDVRELSNNWGLGFVYITRVDGIRNMYFYLAKYISKEFSKGEGRMCASSKMEYKAYKSKLDRIFAFSDLEIFETYYEGKKARVVFLCADMYVFVPVLNFGAEVCESERYTYAWDGYVIRMDNVYDEMLLDSMRFSEKVLV